MRECILFPAARVCWLRMTAFETNMIQFHINCPIPLVYLKGSLFNSVDGRWELNCHVHTANESGSQIQYLLEIKENMRKVKILTANKI